MNKSQKRGGSPLHRNSGHRPRNKENKMKKEIMKMPLRVVVTVLVLVACAICFSSGCGKADLDEDDSAWRFEKIEPIIAKVSADSDVDDSKESTEPEADLGFLFPFALGSIVTRRRKNQHHARAKSLALNPNGILFGITAIFAVLVAVSATHAVLGIPQNITPYFGVGVLGLMAALPLVGRATIGSSVILCGADDDESGSTSDSRLACLSEDNYQSCLRAFRMVKGRSPEKIQKVKDSLEELCFLTPEVVEKAYLEVIGTNK